MAGSGDGAGCGRWLMATAGSLRRRAGPPHRPQPRSHGAGGTRCPTPRPSVGDPSRSRFGSGTSAARWSALLGAWKPDPTVHLVAPDGLGVPPGQCVAVEDSAAGVRAAGAAGMRVIHYCRDRHVPTNAAVDFRAISHLITRRILIASADRGGTA